MDMLSKLEEMVLIWTSIYAHIVALTGREVTVSNVFFPLGRLVRRGLLLAVQGEPTPKRGGMGKR